MGLQENGDPSPLKHQDNPEGNQDETHQIYAYNDQRPVVKNQWQFIKQGTSSNSQNNEEQVEDAALMDTH